MSNDDDEVLKRLKQRVHELYGPRGVFVDKIPKMLRHEDSIPGGSGTWVDVSVFVPDEDVEKIDVERLNQIIAGMEKRRGAL